MFRNRKLLLLILSIAFLAPVSWAQWIIEGVPTSNEYKILSSAGGPYGNPALAVRAALSKGASSIQFVQGLYPFTATADIDKSDVEIRVFPGAILYVSNTNATAVFNITASRVSLVGPGTIELPTVTQNQVCVNVTGDEFRCSMMRFDCTTATAAANALATAAVFLKVDSFLSRVERCNFFPNKGVLCIDTPDTAKRSLQISHCNFGTNQTGGITAGVSATARKAVGAIRIIGTGWCEYSSNNFFGLGDATDPVTFVVRLQRSLTGSETGHVDFMNNRIEACYTNRCYLDLWGIFSTKVFGNTFGYPVDSINAAGEAALIVTGVTGTAFAGPPGNKYVYTASDVDIVDNNFHNIIKGAGASCIRIEQLWVGKISNNVFTGMAPGALAWGIVFVTDATANTYDALVIEQNEFSAAGASAAICVGRTSTANGNVGVGGMILRNNTYSTVGTWAAFDDLAAGTPMVITAPGVLTNADNTEH